MGSGGYAYAHDRQSYHPNLDGPLVVHCVDERARLRWRVTPHPWPLLPGQPGAVLLPRDGRLRLGGGDGFGLPLGHVGEMSVGGY